MKTKHWVFACLFIGMNATHWAFAGVLLAPSINKVQSSMLQEGQFNAFNVAVHLVHTHSKATSAHTKVTTPQPILKALANTTNSAKEIPSLRGSKFIPTSRKPTLTQAETKPIVEKITSTSKSIPDVNGTEFQTASPTQRGEFNAKNEAYRESEATRTGARNSADVSDRFTRLLMQRMAKNKHYPFKARLARKEGIALVEFAVDAHGSLTEYQMLQSTNEPELDDAVRQIFHKAFPLKGRILSFLPSQGAHFSIPIAFSLTN